MNLKKSVKVWNAKLDTTQKELAAELNITNTYLSRLLSNNDTKRIEAMAAFYHIPVSAFIEAGE